MTLAVEQVPALDAAAELAAGLALDAARLEREGVTRADLDPLAEAGLFGLWAAPEAGGKPVAVRRRVAELLAGASPDAWFVWFQHNPVVAFLTLSDNAELADRELPALTSGERRGGVAFSHLRSSRPGVTAERVDGGWRLSGLQPWCTGWGLVDVVLAGAHEPEGDEVVFGLVEAREQPGLRSAGELMLAAMGGTSTHALRFEGLLLPDSSVVLRRDRAGWAAADAAANANVQPSTPGVALAALDLLAERQPDVAAALRARVLDARTRAYALQDDAPPGEQVPARLAVRAELHELAVLCATALLAARGGAGMDLDDPAQRLLRAAAFQVVHSQAPHVREAQLARLLRAA